jgi:hypothetical protein
MPADSNGDATTRWVSQGLNPSYELLRRDRAGDDAGGRGEIRPPRRIDPAKLPGVTATLDFIAIVITIVVPRSAIAYLRMRATWPSPGIQNPCRGVLALNETQGLWIPGSRFACPGMTKKNFFLRERSRASERRQGSVRPALCLLSQAGHAFHQSNQCRPRVFIFYVFERRDQTARQFDVLSNVSRQIFFTCCHCLSNFDSHATLLEPPGHYIPGRGQITGCVAQTSPPHPISVDLSSTCRSRWHRWPSSPIMGISLARGAVCVTVT